MALRQAGVLIGIFVFGNFYLFPPIGSATEGAAKSYAPSASLLVLIDDKANAIDAGHRIGEAGGMMHSGLEVGNGGSHEESTKPSLRHFSQFYVEPRKWNTGLKGKTQTRDLCVDFFDGCQRSPLVEIRNTDSNSVVLAPGWLKRVQNNLRAVGLKILKASKEILVSQNFSLGTSDLCLRNCNFLSTAHQPELASSDNRQERRHISKHPSVKRDQLVWVVRRNFLLGLMSGAIVLLLVRLSVGKIPSAESPKHRDPNKKRGANDGAESI
jgi:hypothetical protein